MTQTTTLPAIANAKIIRERTAYHLRYSLGKAENEATQQDVYRALALSVRRQLIDGVLETQQRHERHDAKRVAYLSAEFLIGQSLRNNLFNLGLLEEAEKALQHFGHSLADIANAEPDAALGNGGLGRLAACFMESLSTLNLPARGYGINYQFGLFKQEIEDGRQKERPEQWLSQDSPWLIERADEACHVPIYGRVDHAQDRDGNYNPMWVDWKVIVGVPHDLPIAGLGGQTVNVLRLYSARASDEFDMQIFNDGDYLRAVEQKIVSETVSKVLYPSDAFAAGKELRLVQEYFLVACALRDLMRGYSKNHVDMDALSSKLAIQLNDTHPSLAVVELMRILVDEQQLPWDRAWETTTAICGYTNHTLMPEALEKWPLSLMERVLPRHLQLIFEINRRFLGNVEARYPDDHERLAKMSLIEEGGEKQVRMANLAIVGSHAVNGVAALHSELVKKTLVPEFYDFWPERFGNVTNGVTHRRWLASANPQLASLISSFAGKQWVSDFSRVSRLENAAHDPNLQNEFLSIKRQNKHQLAAVIYETTGITVSPDSMFDVQVKRIHEYKRQLLCVMHVIHSYLSLVEDGVKPAVPRTFIFAGKAAPGYWMAKLIIKLINDVSTVVNNDPVVQGHIRVVFLPNYRVTLAEKIIPAADLSEQVSTAGTEASGTGNMKFAMNGALTMGTLDGANIEILEAVGRDNIYIFGLTTPEVQALRGNYNPWDHYHADARLRRVVDALGSDRFSPAEPGLFRPIYDTLMRNGDHYLHLADFSSYLAAQEKAGAEFRNPSLWARKAILNVARMGRFTSDRSIAEYAEKVWNLAPIVD
jgi:starch phosphorylase